MNNTTTGGPAYPVPGLQENSDYDGMTLLDWFAGQIIRGMINETGMLMDEFADEAYRLAAKMIEARKKHGTQ